MLMKKNKKNMNSKAFMFIIYGLIVYLILLFLGPYKYKIYSVKGIVYYCISYSMFIFGAFLGDRPLDKYDYKGDSIYNIELSKRGELLVIFLLMVGSSGFILYIMYVFIVGGVNYEFATEDLRQVISKARPIWHKISEVCMYLPLATYLITGRIYKYKYKLTKRFANIAVFFPSIGLLAVGARSGFVITLIMIIIIKVVKKDVKIYVLNKKNKRNKNILMICIMLILTTYVFQLFTTRGVDKYGYDVYLIEFGDVEIRDYAINAMNFTDNKISPLIKASNYYTHSLPFFSWLYENSEYEKMYLGSYLIGPLDFVLKTLKIPTTDFEEIINSQPKRGFYPTFIQGYILDWGKFGALLMILLTGFIFGRVSFYKYRSKFCIFFLPVVLSMCFISPIYYFWHSYLWVILWYFIVYIICRKSIKIIRNENMVF